MGFKIQKYAVFLELLKYSENALLAFGTSSTSKRYRESLRKTPPSSYPYTQPKTCAVLPVVCRYLVYRPRFNHSSLCTTQCLNVMWSAGQREERGKAAVDTPFSHFLIIFWIIVMTSQCSRNTCVLSTGCVTLRCHQLYYLLPDFSRTRMTRTA